jgi:hypothetical protein
MPDLLQTLLLSDAVLKGQLRSDVLDVRVVKADRMPKAAVGYVYAPGTSLLCGQCAFIAGGKCTDHPGKEENVDLDKGSCNDWQDRRKGPVTGNRGRSWVQVAYLENAQGFGCRRCAHMDLKGADCDAVDKDSPGDNPGRIDPYGCCTLWKKDAVRGSWPETRF